MRSHRETKRPIALSARALIATLCAIWTVGVVTPIAAQEPASGHDEAAMERVSSEAMTNFQNNKMGEAARLFEEAYGHYPEPVLLKNATVSWFSVGQCAKADSAGSRYLEATVGEDEDASADRRDVKTVIARCRLRAARAALSGGDLEAAAENLENLDAFDPLGDDAKAWVELTALLERERAARAQQSAPTQGASSSASSRDGSTLSTTAPSRPVAAAPPAGPLRPLGWTLVGVGAAGGVVTVLDNMQQSSRVQRCTDAEYYENNEIFCQSVESVNGEDSEAVEAINRRAYILGISSGVVAISGAVMLLIHRKRVREYEAQPQRVTLSPQLGRDHAGLHLTLRF